MLCQSAPLPGADAQANRSRAGSDQNGLSRAAYITVHRASRPPPNASTYMPQLGPDGRGAILVPPPSATIA